MTDTLPEPLRLAKDADELAIYYCKHYFDDFEKRVASYATCLRSTHAEAEKLRTRVAELEAELAEEKPDMFWNYDDPESPYSSIGEFLNDEWCQSGLSVGDIRRVQRAIRLRDVMVRVTAVSDDGDIDYVIDAIAAKEQ